MTEKEDQIYYEALREFKTYSKEILKTKEFAQAFLVRTGINTPTGRLTKRYKPSKDK